MSDNGTDLDRALLEWCRPVMIVGAFFTQRPSIMGQPEWTAALTSQQRRELGLAFDMFILMNVLAELPALFVQCDEYFSLTKTKSSVSAPVQTTLTWNKVSRLQQQLLDWNNAWYDNNKIRHSKMSLNRPSKNHTPLWTTVFYFDSAEAAIQFSMYHSAMILLTSIPISLIQANLLGPKVSVPNNSASYTSSYSQALFSDVLLSIHCICRSIEYYLQDLEPPQAPQDFYLFFPVHVARRASTQHGYSSELAYLAEAFELMTSKFSKGVWANTDFGDRFDGSKEGMFG